MTIRKFKLLPALALSLIGAAIIYSSNQIAIRAASAAMDQTAPQDRPEANRNPGDAQEAAARFYLQKRLPEGEREIPVERYLEAREQARRAPRYSTAQSRFLSQAEAEADSAATWTELGPGNIGGRTRALIIHPTNHDTMYAAAAAGGVWKTTDGGASWRPLADLVANLAVNALAMDRSDPNVLYAGTGEGFFNFDAIRGAGIFKTVDGGATWTRLASAATADFHYVNDIVVSPTDGRRVYAATRTGVWRSIDSGASWTRTLDPAVTGGCLDLVIRSDQTTDYLFASCGTFAQAKVYRNTDASSAGAWTEVLNDPGMGRTSLALAPSNQNIIYAASANPATSNQPGLHAIFRSTASGDPNTWTAQVRKTDANKLNTVLFTWTRDAFFSNCGLGPDRFFNTGWYANSMAVDPIDANRVWVGGVELFRSDDGGANWGLASYSWIDANAPQYAHTHHHAIVFHPQYNGASNKTMFVAGDGGIYKTSDALAATATGTTAPCDPSNSATQWTSLNHGYAATQFYHGSPYPDGTRYLAGASGHGFLRGSDGDGVNGWRQMLSRDGGFVVIDPANPNVIYAATSGSFIRKSVDGGQTFAPAYHGISDPGFVYIAPLVVDPSDGSRLWTGGRALWLSVNGAARWSQASPALQQGSVTAIAVAPDDSNLVLAGTNAGVIIRNANALSGSGQWTSATLRAGYVSWLAFDPVDHNVVYATYSTFGGGHVWRSADGGATWSGIDGAGAGALPDVPVHSIVVDPQNRSRLFIGTDVGIFVTTDGGVTWAVESGTPNVVTEALALNAGSNATQLYAFTYGRGAWRTSLGANDCRYSLSPASVNIKPEGGAGSVNVSAPNGCPWSASVNASGASGAEWIRITGASGGSGAGTINFSVEPNSGSLARAGTITIAGRSFTVSQAGKLDAQRPQVKIINPTSESRLTTELSVITLSGVASDDTGVTQVSWAADRGSNSLTPFPISGQANGTTAWTTPAITLQPGVNLITITARDTTGKTGSAELTVIFNPSATLVTIAGAGNKDDGHPAYYAKLFLPRKMALDAAGNIYVAEGGRVRKIDARTGFISTIAGAGSMAPLGDGGPATQARLESPSAVLFDPAGNIIVVDYGQNRIRKITPDGIINTIAGNGCDIFGCGPNNGDGGPATQARIAGPIDVVFDRAGNFYITEVRGNRVRKVDAQTGIITTAAGNGLGPAGGPGGDGGPATEAQFEDPAGLAIDAADNLYISDSGAHKIRKVTASTGIISTIAGTGSQSFSGDGGPATVAALHSPNGLYLDATGNLYIADYGNGRVRKIAAGTGVITTVAGGGAVPPGDGASPFAVELSPLNIAFDQAGNMLIASHPRIYKILPFRTPDTMAPVVVFTAPTREPEITVNTANDLRNLRFEGTVSDNVGFTHITWRNDRGGAGVAHINSDRTWVIHNVPLLVGRNNLTVTAWDAAGNGGSAKLAVVFNTDRIARTLAGNQVADFGGDGGPGIAARLWAPEGIALDAAGNLYVADTGNHRVRKITRDGRISTVAGNGLLGASGDGGLATEASLNSPRGVAVDAAGNLFISDTGNHRIRKVTTAGVINTVAGVGTEGFSGDGGPATNARLNNPYGLATDAAGNLYFADWGNHRVRKIAASNGAISSVVGGGFGFGGDGAAATAARLSFPRDVKLDAAGNLYIADTANARIRKVTTAGIISTFAGNGQVGQGVDDVPAINSPLASPFGLAFDQSGNLFFTDSGNSIVRKIGADGIITTIIGSAPVVFGDEGLPASSVRLAAPTGVAIDRAGNLYVAESARNRVLIISDNRSITSVQAASFTGPSLAGESIVAAFGANLAATTQAATELPLPTTLAGTTVRLRDSLGQEMFAPLFFVSPNQINYQMPPGLANGPATAIATNQSGATYSGDVMIETTAPGLFSANANGQGVAAAVALRIKPDGAQVYEPVAVFDQTSNRFVVRPLDFGATGDQLFLILFGTGLRRATLGAVNAQTGGETVETLFVGAQGGFAGLDQINLSLPRTLAGRGEVDVALSVDGKATNTLRIALAGAPCSFQVSAPDQTVTAAGGVITVNVASANSCFWSARSNANWITTNFNGVASGAGAVTFSVSPNASPLPRAGEIRVAGQTVILTQAGTESSPPPTVTVTRPSDTGSFTTPEPVVSFSGVASAGAGIAFLTWSNDRGGSGFAGGTINWAVEDVRLQVGVNNLTVTAYDSLGRAGSARYAVNFKPEWQINTVAGGGQNDPTQGGRATDAKLEGVANVVVDAAGNIYLSSGPRVFKVTPAGVISVFAGNGQTGLGADNVPATSSSIGFAGGLALDREGNLYIAGTAHNLVRKVDIRTNIITTVAGRNAPDNYGFSGDGGPATEARLNYPTDVAFDSAGNLYIADFSNHRIRKVDAATQIITTVAGNGNYGGPLGDGGDAIAATIGWPTAVAVDTSNNLYVTASLQIRKINLASGRISTFIQNGVVTNSGGTVINAIYYPVGLAADAQGNLLFASSNYTNSSFTPSVWRVAAQTGSIVRLAGDRTTGPLGDGGPAVLARLEAAIDVALDAAGAIYIADGTRVRKLTPFPTPGAASNKFIR